MKRNIKKMAAALIITIIAASFAVGVSAETGYKLLADGKEVQLSNPVVYSDGYNLAPMAEIMRLLGAEVSWEPNTKTVTAKNQDNEISFTIGSAEAIVNGAPVTMDIPPKIISGVTYVPVGFIAKSLGYGVDWSADTKTIELKPPGAAGVEADRLDVTFKDRYPRNLSYDEAYSRATTHSKDLKTLNNTIRDAQVQRVDVINNATGGLTSDSIPISSLIGLTSSMRSALSTLDKLDTTIVSEKYQREIYEESIASGIKAGFLEIVTAQNKIATANAEIELSKMALESSKLRYELGIISEVAYEAEVFQHQQRVDAQATNERALEELYVSMNKLLGYDADERYNVSFDDEYIPLAKDFNLENYITRMIGESPTLKISQLSLEQAERNAKTALASSASELQQTKSAITSAELEFEDAKKSYENNIRSAYKSLRDLETQIASLEIDLKKAKVDADTEKVKYETGDTTRLQLLSKLYAVDSIEKGIEIAKKNYALSKFAFYRPYLLRGA